MMTAIVHKTLRWPTRRQAAVAPSLDRLHLWRLLLLASCILGTSVAGFAQARVYVPAAPPGSNSATYAAPRDEWLITVQGKFDKYSGKHADILFDGDSITNRWEITGKAVWEAKFAGRAADFGIEGDRTENLLWRLSKGQVTGVDPKLVVLMIGTNNVVRNTSGEIASGIEAIVSQYETLCPSAHIILMSVFPRGRMPSDPNRMKLAEVNQALATRFTETTDPRVTLVDISTNLTQHDGTISADMMPDMLHPAADGYRLWADALQPYVDKYAPVAAK
ncbi:GDSL-type esterase/lipase family protein [Granulicella mallensis]|uniref:Lysophospholipase L1-like esterase n=1 Tax=Granulicella mallensis TaxID=940614 RepID=A0A7W8EBY0_9BACT|nr:GDSL-type esterase/lipase family protein [Granulicella mallensis]MBB5066317.1 lysophospholipase L1-like esterase [Granulicella mallensis]